MVQIKEFRTVMPLSLAEYEVAQMYMVLKMQQENTTNTEGLEVLGKRPFEDNVFGKGHYTSKVYNFQSKIPSWLTTFAPADSLLLKEEAWNAYPKCKSVLECPSFSKMLLTIDTIHVADNGSSENVHGLNEDQLALREVEVIDIASSVRDYWSYMVGSCNVDLSTFRSTRTNRGPLLEGWREHCKLVMTAYILVTVDAPYWGFGRRLEQVLLQGGRALFLESHSNIFVWIDEWYGMNIIKLRELEEQLYSSPNQQGLRKNSNVFDRKCSLECKDACMRSSQSEEQKFAMSD